MSYFKQSKDLATSFVFVLPILVLYEVGLVVTGFETLNGVDFLTVFLFRHWGLQGVILFNLVLIAVFLVAIIRLEKKGEFRPAYFIPMVLESFLYASFLGSVILFVMQKSYLLGRLPDSLGPVDAVVVSLGAGVNEEIFFRLVLLGAIAFSCEEFLHRSPGESQLWAVLVSSVLFSAAHYIPPHGDAFTLASFVYRFLAGVIFALLYTQRSFAVAVYTHAIYDIQVLLLR